MALAPQTQWSLDQTASATMSFARGLLMSATIDNIQIIALAACEKFGATLAMCDETTLRIDELVSKQTAKTGTMLNILQLTVGYSKNDCAAYLIQNQAGLNFLGLATALISTTDPFSGAKVLQLALKECVESDNVLLPKISQLKDLLMSLENRLVHLRYLELVLQCRRLQGQNDFHEEICLPSPKSIVNMIYAFRQLRRLGDAKRILIRAATVRAAWVIAFARWCLGPAISVFNENGMELLNSSSGHTFAHICICAQLGPDLEIQIEHEIESPTLLISPRHDRRHFCSGLISLKSWPSELFERKKFSQFLTEAAPLVLEAFTRYAIPRQVLESWCSIENPYGPAPPDLVPLAFRPFGDEDKIARILDILIGQTNYVERMSRSVTKAEISKLLNVLYDRHFKWNNEEFESLKQKSQLYLMHVVQLAMYFSLFEEPWELLLDYDLCRASPLQDTVAQAIMGILTSNRAKYTYDCYDFIRGALALVCHKPREDPGQKWSWVMSSFKGQVIYMKIYETLELRNHHCLQLGWACGSLYFHDTTYKEVCGELPRSSLPSAQRLKFEQLDTLKQNAMRPFNLYSSRRLRWEVTPLDDYLDIHLKLQSDEWGEVGSGSIDPEMLMSSLFVSHCNHKRDAELTTSCTSLSDEGFVLSHAWDNVYGFINIIPTDQNTEMRFFSLSVTNEHNAPKMIIRGNACLACCIGVARKYSADSIML